jgi:hypothetical protein
MQPQPPHVFQQHPGAMQQQPMVAPPQQGMPPPAAMQYRKRPSEVDTLSKHIKYVFFY